MFNGARRLLLRFLHACARRACLMVCLWLMVLGSGSDVQAGIINAEYTEPTARYGHAILGDDMEYASLVLTVNEVEQVGSATAAVLIRSKLTVRLPLNRVFEDVMPRLIDVDGDGTPEVIVIETDVAKGAQLAIYDDRGEKIAATPYIGRTHRWLAPVGAADLDGDGHIEIAYIDRPHLAKILRIWRFDNGKLTPVADQPGLTNHRIGWDHIPGGIRTCDGKAEIITANADWSRIIATTLNDGSTLTADIGAYTGVESLNAALTCN
jgi:hypothetical protein